MAGAAKVVDGTPDTRDLCREIAELSGGTVLLGFSRGKDSIAAWLWLRELGIQVIPFHVAAVPGLSFVNRSLDYYEQWFGVPIERCVEGCLPQALGSLYYQPGEDEDWIDALDLTGYDNHYVADWVREKRDVPRAWVAWGINSSDSIDRRIYVNQYKGRIDSRRSFYPCFDWAKSQILETIQAAGVRLPEDYLLGSRSFAGLPTVRHMARMREKMSGDFERVKLFYPFAEAVLARNEFRRASSTANKESLPRTGNGSGSVRGEESIQASDRGLGSH